MARTSTLGFMKRLPTLRKASKIRDFWKLESHSIPESGGVYILISDEWFIYPNGRSPVLYIGQSANLRARLTVHLKHSLAAKENRRSKKYPLYWPRYEYAAKLGCRYAYVQTHQGIKPRALEEEILASFARSYLTFPVANGSGSWNRVIKKFARIEPSKQ